MGKPRIYETVVEPTLKSLARSRFASAIEGTAVNYLDIRRGFSYDMANNGELGLINACIACTKPIAKPFVFFDVGANEGAWTAAALTALQGHSEASGHLFEVSAHMVGTLTKRFADSHQLSINHLALSDSDGPVEFTRFPNAEGLNTLLTSSKFWEHLSSEREIAEAITGDSYCDETGISHIDLLKIDTEGWDWCVIQGFSRMLREHRVSVVQFEYGYTSGDLRFLMKDFFDYFQGIGYVVGPLRKHGVVFRDFEYSDNDFKSGPNYVAALPTTAPVLSNFADG